MNPIPLQPDIRTLARRRANELRDLAIGDALAWLRRQLRPRRRAAATVKEATCRS